jgi:hypothetical protein
MVVLRLSCIGQAAMALTAPALNIDRAHAPTAEPNSPLNLRVAYRDVGAGIESDGESPVRKHHGPVRGLPLLHQDTAGIASPAG